MIFHRPSGYEDSRFRGATLWCAWASRGQARNALRNFGSKHLENTTCKTEKQMRDILRMELKEIFLRMRGG